MEQNSKLNNDDFSKNTFQHLMNFFILPEINKRQAKGELPIPVELIKVQIVFYPDERRHQIRINDEVSAIAELKLKKGVGKKKGEPIIQHETEGIGEIQLTQKDDPNCAHVLLLNIGEKWLLSYDFRYNKALSKEFIKRSNEFIECAEFSYQKKYWGSFVDNLFSASELLATSILYFS